MKRKRIDIITLGCSKNLVDSEQLMRQLEEVGYSVTHDTEKSTRRNCSNQYVRLYW